MRNKISKNTIIIINKLKYMKIIIYFLIFFYIFNNINKEKIAGF